MRDCSRGVISCLALAASFLPARNVRGQEDFFRGDCGGSAPGPAMAVDVADAAALMSFLFEPQPERFDPPCLDACDADDSGAIDLADVARILQYYAGFEAFPPAPGPGLEITNDPNPNMVRPSPPGPDPMPDGLGCTATGGPDPPGEVCDDGSDNDGDGLVDLEDTDCQRGFVCGGRRQDASGNPLGFLEGVVGSDVEVCFFIRSTEDNLPGAPQLDHVQGFSMALSFCCELTARESLDVSGTLLEAIGGEFIAIHADNDANDGDGCELVINVLMDAAPPFEGLSLPPLPIFQRVGCVEFSIPDDPALCGVCCPIDFQDGVNGRGKVPVKNLMVAGNRSFSPQSMNCEVCIRERERFFRGDCNFSQMGGGMAVDIADAAALVNFLTAFGVHRFNPPCLDACDCDDNGVVNLADALCILRFYFQEGPLPPAPGPSFSLEPFQPTPPGVDPTPDGLDCEVGSQCLALLGGGGADSPPGGGGAGGGANFVRGDHDQNGEVSIGDPVAIVHQLFFGGPTRPCTDAGDANDDGIFDLGDALYIFSYLFQNGSSPPSPFPAPGQDPSADTLSCGSYSPVSPPFDPAVRLSIDDVVFPHVAGARATAVVRLTSPAEVAAFTISIGHDPALLVLESTGVAGAAAAADAVFGQIFPGGGGVLGVVLDLIPPFTGTVIPPGDNLQVAQFRYRLPGQPPAEGEFATLRFVDGVFGSPVKANRVVIGIEVRPAVTDGRALMGPGPRPEDCDNGIDDDFDGLTDGEDPDCIFAFAIGSRVLDRSGFPGPLGAPPGGTVPVDFFVRTVEDNRPGPEQFDHVEGFSMALSFCCDLVAGDTFDTAGTILEALGAEFVSLRADNDSNDGDGCELVIGALMELSFPHDRLRISPLPYFQRLGSVDFTVKESVECGTRCLLQFQDGVNGLAGVPIKNLVSSESRSFSPLLLSAELAVGDLDADGDGRADGCIDELPFGIPVNATLTPPAPRLYRRFRPPLGATILITLDGDPGDANALYVRWGRPPAPGCFDAAADRRFQPDQRLVLAHARDEVLYVLAQGNIFDGGANDVILLARLARLELESMSATHAGAGGEIHAAVLGGGFEPTMALRLVQATTGRTIQGSGLVIVAPDRAEVVFDLRGAEPGLYDLVAEDAALGLNARLAGAFTVVETREPPLVEATLHGPDRYRYDRIARLTLRYRNLGDAEIAAPLFKVVGPAGTNLRLAREEGFEGNELQVLGFHPNGVPGRLPPGAEVEIPIFFRTTATRSGPVEFQLFLFTPSAGDYVGWDRAPRPAGMRQADWDALWPLLSLRLGATGREYAGSLAALATRLARRGVYPGSVRELLRFAAREVYGRPTAAILGRATFDASGIPLAGQHVLALQGNIVKASALTDESGAFAIDWLEGEGTYDLALTGHRIVASNLGTRVTLPGSDDLRLLEIAAVEEEENDRRPGCGNCDEHALPGSALALPGALFTELAARQVLVVSSWDPNEKRGPEGEGKNRLIPADEPVEYTIHFENRPQATAAAEVVEVFDTLDGDLDCATIRLLDLQIGNVSEQRVALDTIGTDLFSARNRALGEERYSAAGELEVAPSGRMVGQEDAEVVQVDYTVARDPECSTVRWVLALRRDASAGEDAAEGFLPRNCTETCPDCSAVPDGDHPCKDGRGEGHITFSVMPLPGLPEETEIVNDARVLFDGFPDPEAETQWVNRISYFLPPGMPAHPLPADNEESVETGAALQWEAPGADEFDVLLWREGTPQALVSEGRRERFHRPSGGLSPGTRYFWTVVARNENDEVQPPAPWSFTTARPCANPGAPSQPDPPVGAVGVQDCALAWSPGNGARAHEVFLWQGDQRPKTPVATGLVESRFDGRLALVEEAEYRWQVVSLDGACRTEGPVWRFRTREKQFRRGDADGSGGLVNLTDGIFLLNYLYLGGPVPPCQRSADSENDDDMDLTDVVRLLNHLYLGGPEPPAPGPNACGADPEPAAAALTCECYPPCQSS